MTLEVGVLVWEKWRNDWYMGQVVAAEDERIEEREDDVGEPRCQRVKIHIHGEPEPQDKWHDVDSANIVELVEVDAKETAVGVFPQTGDHVELLVMDVSLAHELRGEELLLLQGTVVRVFPRRDASMVDVVYPPGYTHVPSGLRRVCIRVVKKFQPS